MVVTIEVFCRYYCQTEPVRKHHGSGGQGSLGITARIVDEPFSLIIAAKPGFSGFFISSISRALYTFGNSVSRLRFDRKP